ncbi:hypothetical protein [Streptomyces chiangmaiensis]|uniref:Uncharacterized protein n=1 Tax=Streptomyces chiangmaiensis TaxID=766497 RepID=A0ABU7FT48_9ACTN|nr:hypothetical protein [Streptomyces chiangmaiensis]MED7827143.1 hypothetical protein [Streptomyces chiangmaiensis]
MIGGWSDRRFPELAAGARKFVERHPAVAVVASRHPLGAGLGASHQTGWTGLAAVTATLFHLMGSGDWGALREEPLS